ncbi:MAG: hypothetical protein ACYTHJ_06620 [Planctomycetota bacterium]|jgi:hypothetical protein
MVATRNGSVCVELKDLSGQRRLRMDVPGSASVGEMVEAAREELNLADVDGAGRRVVYRAHAESRQVHLRASDLVGEAVQPDEQIVLQRDVHAG